MRIPREIKVGLLAVVAIVLFLIGLSYLKGRSVLADVHYFKAYYDNISGLTTGSPVLFRGHRVGSVKQITYLDDQGKLEVLFDADNNISIPTDSYAIIETQDILGGMAIVLSAGQAKTLATDGATLQDSLALGMMDKVMQEVDPIKLQLTRALGNVNLVIDDLRGPDSANSRLSAISENLAATTGNLASGTARLKATLNKAEVLMGSIRSSIDSIMQTGNLQRTLANSAEITDSLKRSAGRIDGLLASVDASMANLADLLDKARNGDGSVAKLLNSPDIHNKTDSTLQALEALLTDLRENPKRYVHFSVFGRKEKK